MLGISLHRRVFFFIARSIWKKITALNESEISVKFDERICSNATCGLNVTLGSEKVTESHYNYLLDVNMSIVPENANLKDQLANF